jgi:adenylosuccinate lyase
MQERPRQAIVSDPAIRPLFERDARWQAWLDVEAALARAEAALGMVPPEAAEEIGRKAQLSLLDIPRIEEGLRVTGHPLVPLIWDLDRICDGDAGGYVHWGATTQNITQTGQILLLRRTHHIFLELIAGTLEAMGDLAERSSAMLIPGRTHGQHALPATFGLKVATWIDEFTRHVDRLRECEPRLFVAMLGGGAGTVASFGEQGLAVQDRLAEELGLGSMPVPARTIVDHLAEYVTVLAMLDSTCARIAREIYTLMKQEFGEVEEPVPPGSVGSSTMPQKRNPKNSQAIISAEAQVRAMVPLAIEAMQVEHEADAANSGMIGRAVSETCMLTGDILSRLVAVLGGLQLFPERMRANLDLSGGMIMSEALMLELGAVIGRQQAHDVIYEAAQESATSGRPFDELLMESEEVSSRLSREEVQVLLDPSRYTGQSQPLAEAGAAQARELAAALREMLASAPA